MDSNSGGEDRKREHEVFNKHLERASELVKSWPAWKQEVLGKSSSSDLPRKRCT